MADTTNVRNAPERNIAVLVDGDNAQPSLVEEVLAEAVKYGTTTVRRIYGDWTTPSMSGWKVALQNDAFQPQQQFRYTTGKNATDSALIIDAMDLLHSGRIDGFCIVSSDSDFTRLATRIREHGLFVMGIGEPKTPRAFVNACEVFVLTTNLGGERKAGNAPEGNGDWTKVIRQAVVASAREDGWAFLGAVGVWSALDPAFDREASTGNQSNRRRNARVEAHGASVTTSDGRLTFEPSVMSTSPSLPNVSAISRRR